MNTTNHTQRNQVGSSMIEVLVTLIILLVGLLGLAGLQMHGQRSQMESYQRVQALILLQDMVGRINANRLVGSCYAFTTTDSATTADTPYVGTTAGGNHLTMPPACAAGTADQNNRAIADLTAWDNALLGTAEIVSGVTNVGAMIGARGCVTYSAALAVISPTTASAVPGTGIYTASVAWQGLGATSAPPADLGCGFGLYGAETQRRVISINIRIANLGAT